MPRCRASSRRAAPQGHPDKRVYAMKPCFYYGRAYAVGEVFVLNGDNVMADDELLAAGVVKSVPRSVTPLPHTPTGRWFLDKTTLTAYALDYETGDVSGWVPETSRAKERAQLAARTRRGAPPAAWKSWTREETLAKFVKAAQTPSTTSRTTRSRRRLAWERLCRVMKPSMNRNTTAKIAKHHQITRQDIEAELHK